MKKSDSPLCYSVCIITGIFEKEYGKCVSSEIFDVVLISFGIGFVFFPNCMMCFRFSRRIVLMKH